MDYQKIKEAVSENFRNTFEETSQRMLAESSLSRAWGHMQNRAVGFITAFRGDNSKSENMKLNRKLYADLMQADSGIGVTRVRGNWIENSGTENEREVGEATYMVTSPVEGDDNKKLEKILVKLGTKYDQDAILIKNFDSKAKLIGTTRRAGADPSYGQSISVGNFKGGKVSQFLTRIGGRPFIFESAEEIEYPKTRNGRWALKILSETAIEDL